LIERLRLVEQHSLAEKKTMKKKTSLIAGIMILAALCVLAPRPSQAATELVLAHVFGVSSIENLAASRLADIVAEKSGGKYEVVVFPASQLGGFTEIYQQMRTGAVNMGFTSTVVISGMGEVASADSWPFMFDSREEFEKGYASEAGQYFLKQVREKTGYEALSPAWKGFRQIVVNKNVNVLNDLKGMKIRVPGFNIVLDTFRAWGLAPTPMAVSEMFTAMQQGVVDGVEFEMQNLADIGVQEVSKTLVVVNYSAANYVWPMWGDYFDSLSAEDRKMLREATAEASAWFANEVKKYEDRAYTLFEEAKVKIIRPDTSEWRKIAATALAEKYPELYKVSKAMSVAGKAK
jgi:tripartite ATP-independent transporter DctP family solute receptor